MLRALLNSLDLFIEARTTFMKIAIKENNCKVEEKSIMGEFMENFKS